MPLYEYTCRQCGHEFEALVRDSLVPVCPSCQAPDVERMLSLFSVSSDGENSVNMTSLNRWTTAGLGLVLVRSWLAPIRFSIHNRSRQFQRYPFHRKGFGSNSP